MGDDRTHLTVIDSKSLAEAGLVLADAESNDRRIPVLCKDCRFSGWLREWDYSQSFPARLPTHCLFISGGANPTSGDRVIREDVVVDYFSMHPSWLESYPKLPHKNADGDCKKFIAAKKLPWWKGLFRSARRIRE